MAQGGPGAQAAAAVAAGDAPGEESSQTAEPPPAGAWLAPVACCSPAARPIKTMCARIMCGCTTCSQAGCRPGVAAPLARMLGVGLAPVPLSAAITCAECLVLER